MIQDYNKTISKIDRKLFLANIRSNNVVLPQGINFVKLWNVLDIIFTNIDFDIFKKDEEGNYKYNDKGRPKVNWIKVLKNLGQLVAAIFLIKRELNLK